MQKTPLQIAVQAAMETELGIEKIPFAVNKENFGKRPDEMTDRQICAILRYGKRALNDAYNTTAKAARDEGRIPPDPKAFAEEWFANLGTHRVGTTRSTLTASDSGWIAYFKAAGVKISGKAVNGKTLDDAKQGYVRQVILASVEIPEDHNVFMDEILPGLIEKYTDQVLEAAESDTSKGQPGWWIEQEQAKAAPIQAPSGFKINF